MIFLDFGLLQGWRLSPDLYVWRLLAIRKNVGYSEMMIFLVHFEFGLLQGWRFAPHLYLWRPLANSYTYKKYHPL